MVCALNTGKTLTLEELGFSLFIRDCSSSESHLIISEEQKEIEKDRKGTQSDPKDHHCHQKHDTRVSYATAGITRLTVC